MSDYVNILLLDVVIIYIVDVSGFTEAWRGGLARLLGVKSLRPLPPFDCGKCAAWWGGVIYAIVAGCFTLPVLAWCALLSCLSVTMQQGFIFIREFLNMIFRVLINLTQKWD